MTICQPGEGTSGSVVLPWNAINLVAWALSEVHEQEEASPNPQASPPQSPETHLNGGTTPQGGRGSQTPGGPGGIGTLQSGQAPQGSALGQHTTVRQNDAHHPGLGTSRTEVPPLYCAWNAYTSDENIGKHITEALANYQKYTDVSHEYHRDIQEVYIIIMNSLPSLAKEAQGSLDTELHTTQDQRISIAKDILDTFHKATVSMSL
ncbi:hypothetical protein FRB99_002231 [Tulasnella sp. 403]|nr:hypothetical protein FRB99_002231 [Tulasnella sp. 403]